MVMSTFIDRNGCCVLSLTPFGFNYLILKEKQLFWMCVCCTLILNPDAFLKLNLNFRVFAFLA